jgi:hypothetical protein
VRRFLLLASLLTLSACDDFIFPGDFTPSGTLFSLNPGLRVVTIAGSRTNFSPVGKYTLDLTVEATGAPVTDMLPPGLLLTSKRNAVQHMLVLKPHPFTADSGGTLVVVGTFCCNELRQIPDYQDTFEIGPITDNSGLRRIAELVEEKDITGGLLLVQNAVYEVTSHDSLPHAYVDSLNALPPGAP